jgi:ribosomal protein S27E
MKPSREINRASVEKNISLILDDGGRGCFLYVKCPNLFGETTQRVTAKYKKYKVLKCLNTGIVHSVPAPVTYECLRFSVLDYPGYVEAMG